MLELNQVSKRFGAKQVLNALNLKVHANEIVGLLGPNGAGKSTCLRIAAGVARSDSGTVSISGNQVTPDAPASKSVIGYMPERVPLYGALRVERQLEFVARMRGIAVADIRSAVEEVITKLHLQDVRRQLVGRLSKGFRQRVGLAQSLLGDPSVLLLDEPTSGLDPFQIIEARDYIREVARDRAVVVSTHIVHEMESLCSRVVYLHEGSLTRLSDTAATHRDVRIRLRLTNATADAVTAQLKTAPFACEFLSQQLANGSDLELVCRIAMSDSGHLARVLLQSGELEVFVPLNENLEHQIMSHFANAEREGGADA